MFIRLVALAIAVFPVIARSAHIDDDDLRLARSLMRPGYDLANVQRNLLKEPKQINDWLPRLKAAYLVIRDLNGDGRRDVFMAVERNPWISGTDAASCELQEQMGDREYCLGTREIEVHYQQPDGSYRLGTRTSKLLMSREEGGMSSDPFNGFVVTPKGAIRIGFSGGAGWKWEMVYTVQFRKDDFYVIGTYDYSCNGARDDVKCHETDANLLTGQWTEKTWIGDGRNRKVRKGVEKTNRPYRLTDAEPSDARGRRVP